jgi:small subunit ribosomal protein S15
MFHRAASPGRERTLLISREQRGDQGVLKTGHWQLGTELCYSRTRYENEKRQECNRLVLAREQKQSVVDTYRTHATDTGSPEVQIALLSERIGQLTEHFKTHQKDHGSRRGLLMMVSRRRSLLDYLKKYDSERYKTVISKLGIRK